MKVIIDDTFDLSCGSQWLACIPGIKTDMLFLKVTQFLGGDRSGKGYFHNHMYS